MSEQDALKPLAAGLSSLSESWGRQKYLLGLTRRWPKIVGPVLAPNSLPAYFLGTELWVYTTHAIWMQQLSFSKPEVLAKVNEFLGTYGGEQVSDLRWTLQPADFPSLPEAKPASPPAYIDPVEEEEFQMMTEFISDPIVRQNFRKLWQVMAGRTNN